MNYLVRGRYVLTMNDRFGTEGIIQNGAVYVSEKHIVEVGSYKELKHSIRRRRSSDHRAVG